MRGGAERLGRRARALGERSRARGRRRAGERAREERRAIGAGADGRAGDDVRVRGGVVRFAIERAVARFGARGVADELGGSRARRRRGGRARDAFDDVL